MTPGDELGAPPRAQGIRVRIAAQNDVPAIARIHVQTWQRAYRGMLPDAYLDDLAPEQRISRWEQAVAAPDEAMTVLVAEDSATGTILGFCSVCPLRDPFPIDDPFGTVGELYTMYVDGDVQGRGVGRRLIAAAETVMRERGCQSGVLWMLAENHAARAFYERAGWQRDGVTKMVAYGEREVQEIRLGKRLINPTGDA